MLPLKQALKLPIAVNKKVIFSSLSGEIELSKSATSYKSIKIGFLRNGLTDTKNTNCVLKIQGKVIANEGIHLGLGSKIAVEKNGLLLLGSNLVVTGETTIICHRSVVIGGNCLFSWGITVSDTDSHTVCNHNNEIINHDKAVHIGNHVWLGAKVLVLKGSQIDDNSVVGIASIVTKHIPANSLAVGAPAKVLKENINWSREII
jgi:acetyltransferase-like isoleucine patch superfamily enzyme